MSDLSSFLSTRNKVWNAQLWDGLIEAIGARLAPLEEQLGIQREVADAIIARGLTVIEQELAPIVAQADQILADATQDISAKIERFEHKVTGGTVVSYSTSPASLTEGATINLIVAEADREFFAPTPYLALSRASTIASWAIAKVKSFNRLTGALALTLEQVTGAGGPFSDWVITSLPGATLLQKAYYEQTLGLRNQVSEDKSLVAKDKTDVQNLKSNVEQLKSDTTQIKTETGQIKSAVEGLADDVADVYSAMRLAVAEPLVTPVNPVIGQLWYDGAQTRVYDGVGFVPTVTVSIGGRRYEQGKFDANSDGIVTVGGGYTAAMVYLNGALIREGEDYVAVSPTIEFLNWREGDEYFIEAYLSTDATDFDTKQQVSAKIDTALTGKAVRVDKVQEFSEQEQKQATSNINAVSKYGDTLSGLLTSWSGSDDRIMLPGQGTYPNVAINYSAAGNFGFYDRDNFKWLLRVDRDGVMRDVSIPAGLVNSGRLKVAQIPHMQGGDVDGYVRITNTVAGDSSTLGGINLDTTGNFWYSFNGTRRFQVLSNGDVNIEGNLRAPFLDLRRGAAKTQQILQGYGWSSGHDAFTVALNGDESLSFYSYTYTNGTSPREVIKLAKNGTVTIPGSISKGSGTFLIDHPLAPLNKNLRHGFVEAPEYVNIYRGEVRLLNGKATVDLDEYFGMTSGTFWALNADVTVSALQNQEGFSRVKPVSKMTSGILEIECEDEDCSDLISWMVTGRRKDAFVLNADPNCERGTGRFIPEFEKEE